MIPMPPSPTGVAIAAMGSSYSIDRPEERIVQTPGWRRRRHALDMAEPAGWRRGMWHRRRSVDRPRMTGETPVACDSNIVAGQAVDIRGVSRRDREGPAEDE